MRQRVRTRTSAPRRREQELEMTIVNRARRWVIGCAFVAFGTVVAGQEPPAQPPADWGPMSINLEDVPYPHPVKHMVFSLEGEDVRMAYMDVAPAGTANGRSVILLHGM